MSQIMVFKAISCRCSPCVHWHASQNSVRAFFLLRNWTTFFSLRPKCFEISFIFPDFFISLLSLRVFRFQVPPLRPGVPCCVPLLSPANLRRILFVTFICFDCLFSATSRRGEGIEGPAAWGQDGRGHPAEGEGRLAHGTLRYRSFPRCRRG